MGPESAHLDKLIDEATVDCYNESEEIGGIFTMLEENLAVPFKTNMLGVDVTVERIDLDEAIVAVCRRGQNRQRVPLLDLTLPEPRPRGAEWIDAYLKSLAEFLRIDPDLLEVAAEASRALEQASPKAGEIREWVRNLSAGEKDELVTKFITGEEPTLAMELMRRVIEEGNKGCRGAEEVKRRTGVELLQAADHSKRASVHFAARVFPKVRMAKRFRSTRASNTDFTLMGVRYVFMTAHNHFTTDEYGRVPKGLSLYPNTTYLVRPKRLPPATRLNSHGELADWIEKCVLGDLRTLELGIEHSICLDCLVRGVGGGNFLLLAGCFMALEYFSRIYSPDEDALTCVKLYSRTFLAKINPKYAEAGGLLWRAARNGMVHGSFPRRLAVEEKEIVITIAVGNKDTDPHLKAVPGPDMPQPSLGLSSIRFLRDLEKSVSTYFAPWVRNSHDPAVLERGQPRLLEISKGDHEAIKAFEAILGWNRED